MTKRAGFIQNDASWIEGREEEFFARPDFIEFQELSGVNFRDLLSEDPDVRARAQYGITSQSRIFDQIQREHAGFSMPLLYYTNQPELAHPIDNPNPELEAASFKLTMGDSLRRRHIALSYAILPQAINDLYQRFGRPITALNLGSGIGGDLMNAAVSARGPIESIVNLDSNKEALALGTEMVKHLEDLGALNKGVVRFERKSLLDPQPSDLMVYVGIICGTEARLWPIYCGSSCVAYYI